MGRRRAAGLALAFAVLLLAPAGSADDSTRKQHVDARIAELQARIGAANAREGVLTNQISEVSNAIDGLQGDVDSASVQLDRLESALQRQRRELGRLDDLYRLQTRRLVFLRAQYARAVQRLSRRIVEIYTEDTPDAISFVLSASTFSDVLDQLDYLADIGREDERIARQVRAAKESLHATRERTEATRARVAETTREIARRTVEQRQVRDRLVASRNDLAQARSVKQQALASATESKASYLHEAEGLQQVSAAIGARIRAAQAAPQSSPSTAQPSSSGLIWPVNGPVTSGFGMRWGRLHEGIDIAVPSGTPVHAAAAGTVIYAGWLGGYGNLVVIGHGNELATAYGHNTSIAVSVGQGVAQGQVIAYSGSTGHSTGPHVHFEVRVNGTAVDPLGYL